MTAADSRSPLDLRLRGWLHERRRLRGIFCGVPSAALIEMCAFAGFDFVIIDNEHGSAGHETTEHLLRAARASGIVPVVRCLPHDLSRVLDMGAGAVQIPMVETADEARALVAQVRYPPLGRRGSAFSSRAAGYGAFGGDAHTLRSNDGIALIAMIESPAGVAEAGRIAAVPGVDGVFIGPNDLSHTMGHGADWRHAQVRDAIDAAVRAVVGAGGCAGTLALEPAAEAPWVQAGASFFANVATSVITRALRAAHDG